MAAINETATYYFKSPDTMITGDYKVEVLLIRKEIIPVFFNYNAEDMEDLERIGFQDLQNQFAYEVAVWVNDHKMIIKTEEDTFNMSSYSLTISPLTTIRVNLNEDLIPSVMLCEKYDILRYDRVVDYYWNERAFSFIGEQDYLSSKEERKILFASDLKMLLKRVKNGRIYNVSVSERILRLYKMHFGNTPPKLSLKQIQELGGE